MASDDLLDEGRPRAGHSDDQQRHFVIRSEVGELVEEIRREPLDHAIHRRLQTGAVGIQCAASDGIGHIEMAHRLGVVTEVIVDLAESEVQDHAFLIMHRALREHRLDPADDGLIRNGEFPRPGETAPRTEEPRVEPQRHLVVLCRLVHAAFADQEGGERVVGLAAFRIEREHLAQQRLGRAHVAFQKQCPGSTEPPGGCLRRRRGGLMKARDRPLGVAAHFAEFAEALMHTGELGRQGQRMPERFHRLGIEALPIKRVAQVAIGEREIRLVRDRLRQASDGIGELPGKQQGAPQCMVRGGVLPVREDRLAQRQDGLAGPSDLKEAKPALQRFPRRTGVARLGGRGLARQAGKHARGAGVQLPSQPILRERDAACFSERVPDQGVARGPPAHATTASVSSSRSSPSHGS